VSTARPTLARACQRMRHARPNGCSTWAAVWVGSAAMLLAACSGLQSRKPAAQTYLLAVRAAAAPDAASSSGLHSIQVARPQARPGLDTERIAVLQSGGRADYYARAQWAGALPDVVESLIVDRLRAAGHWPAVESSRSAFPADYLLQVRIAAFEAHAERPNAAPSVTVRLQCTLGDRAEREVLRAFTAEASSDAAGNRMTALVAAFETAANTALDQLEAQVASVLGALPEARVPLRKSQAP